MTGSTGKKILLVDYEVSKMKATEDFLSQAGFDVVKAFDGLDALEKFSEEQPNLVLLSAMLPKLHGFEVCKAIKHSDAGRQIPVLITTSVYKSYKYKRQAMKDYLADDYILKPFNYEELLTKIREHLGLEVMSGDTPGDTEEMKKRPGGEEEKPNGEFDTLLDQTLETLLSKPKDKEGGKSVSSEKKMVVDPDNLDEILESTLSGLMDEIGRKKPVSKPGHKKGPAVEPFVEIEKPPEKDKSPEAEQPPEKDKPPEPEHLFERPEEMETVEHPLPGKMKPEPEGMFSEPEILPDFEVEETTYEAEDQVEEIDLDEASAEIPFTEDVPVHPDVLSPDVTEKDAVEDEPVPEPEKADDKEPLDKIIDEAIAIFDEEVGSDRKDAGDDVVETLSEPPVTKDIFDEPVPGAEVELDSESRFGKYKLIEKIAVGGMAEMWKAKQVGPEGFEKVVALKRILPSLSENDDFITMFIDEGKVAAQLTHPNIAQIYELGETMGGYYLAMEYIAGKDLRTIMRLARKEKKNLAVPQAVMIAMKLLSGLNYAHRKKGFNNENLNIVHRDVSPQNVLISYEGEVKLVDFGIAKAAAKNSITLTGALKGKILYMSPEQAWGQPVDRRSDIFSVGTLLYEMLTGKRVFIADNEMAILQKVRDWNPPPPSAVNARISSRLDTIILKAMEKDPDKRYQTAEEMREELDRFLHFEKPPKKLMDLGFFMRALFKEEIQTEMPELLDDSLEAIDPFALELAKTPASSILPGTTPSRETSGPEEAEEPVSPETDEPSQETGEQVAAELSIADTPETPESAQPVPPDNKDSEPAPEEPVDRDLVPSAVTAASQVKRGSKKTRKRADRKPPEPASAEKTDSDVSPKTSELIIDEDFLKPSRSHALDKRKLIYIGGGAGAIIIIIFLITVFSGGKKEIVPIPAVLPTATINHEATAIANETATAVALFTETPSPSPTETATPVPMVTVVRDTPIPTHTPVPTITQTPTDTPIPTETPTPTIAATETPTPVQPGTYIQYPDVKPEILTRVTPEMPPAARHMGVEGNVTLKVLVSETGAVLDVETLSASDQLEKSGCVKAAQDAVKKWTFKPGTHQGVPVKTHYNLVVPFRRR